MQLTLELTIKSQYNEDTDINDVSVSIDTSKSFSEAITTLELAKMSLQRALEEYIKVMPDGILSEKEFEELVTKPINQLKGFEI
ncbi:hypothetical protein MUK51_10815 [Sphingobacterium faecium]|uniref:hypothetical protein n=1 Tax=Sphingobacterium faecium TaxID=34087 RepID=UPI0021B6AD51|nr:hypothetical protein [Sphingobacterium faecium]UXD67722.1 hypothetical protein MUK51_10815 [Sphingobacterium faecium]